MASVKIHFNNVIFILLATVIAIFPALYNNFPLVTPDSGAYVSKGMALSLPIDRPITYSVFIVLTSLGLSLWYVIAAQGLLFALLVRRLCVKILKVNPTNPIVLAITAIVSFGTQAAWFTAQLSPDAFTGLFLITILLFFIEDKDNSKANRALKLLITVFMLIHYSHILMSILLAVMLWVYHRFKNTKLNFSKIKALGIIALACYGAISTVNLIAGRGFTLSPASHIFMMSRMAENGILDKYLADKCPTEHFEMCNYQGKTGNRQWEFMWMGDFPHVKKGWLDKDVKREYNSIILGTLTSPKYLAMHVTKATDATFRQLTQLYIGDGLLPQSEGSTPYGAVRNFFPYQLKEYSASLQANNQLPISMFNVVIFVSCSMILLAFLFFAGKYKSDFSDKAPIDWHSIFVVLILFLLINAFVTANFSTVIARLQARAFWVLPFVCLLHCMHHLLPSCEVPRTRIEK